MGNPAPYSFIIALFFPIALNYIINRKYAPRKIHNILLIIFIPYIILSIIILIMSMSRTAWLACMLSIIPILTTQLKKSTQKASVSIFVLFICLMATAISFYQLKKESADGRLFIWKITYSIVKEHSLFGIAIGNFPGFYGEAQEEYFREGKGNEYEKMLAGAPDTAYNEYLQIWVETGIFGLMLYLGLLFFTYKNLIHLRVNEVVGLHGSLVCLMVFSFFSYPFRCYSTCILSVLILTWAVLTPFIFTKCVRPTYQLFALAIIPYIYITTSYILHETPTTKQAIKQWDMIRPFFEREQYAKVVSYYRKLYPFLKHKAGFLFEYGQCLSHTHQYNKSNNILAEGMNISSDPMFLNLIGKNYQRLGLYQEAENMYCKAYYRIPHRMYPLFLLMNLYEKEKDTARMQEMANQIIEMEEKIPSSLTRYIKNEAIKKLHK